MVPIEAQFIDTCFYIKNSNLDVELLVCALLTNSIHSNRLTQQPFVLFNLLFCCLIITIETDQKYHGGILK